VELTAELMLMILRTGSTALRSGARVGPAEDETSKGVDSAEGKVLDKQFYYKLRCSTAVQYTAMHCIYLVLDLFPAVL
jgi:hypothetical protein